MLTQQATQLAIPQLQSSMARLLFCAGALSHSLHKIAVKPRKTGAGKWLTEWLAVWA